MGTRSLTVIRDADDKKEICVLYRQYDGYPDGHGLDLAEFLDGFTIVNGFNETNGKIANGPNCLAAQLIAHFKDGVGNFYLYPARTRNCGEDYIYFVDVSINRPINISIGTGKKMTPQDFIKKYNRSLINE